MILLLVLSDSLFDSKWPKYGLISNKWEFSHTMSRNFSFLNYIDPNLFTIVCILANQGMEFLSFSASYIYSVNTSVTIYH